MCKIKKEYYMETSTESSFKRAFRLIIEGYEGNYSNDKDDPGEEMFDQSVNLGIKRAVEHLQRSLNILNDRQTLYNDIKVDGIIGDQTIGAYFKCCHLEKETMLVNVLNMFQAKYYIELMEKRNVFEKFIGLFKRVTII